MDRCSAADGLAARFTSLDRGEAMKPAQEKLLASLIRLFHSLVEKADCTAAYPELSALYGEFRGRLDELDPEGAEDALSRVYCYLHGADSAYTPAERREFDRYGGYWCHAGGLSPLWRAAPWITAETRLADYGAGNGLQGMLFQCLYPHRRTTLIELSGPMIEKGRRLQAFLDLGEEQVAWLHRNVVEVPPRDFDFVYLYRPLRPEEDEGKAFYRSFAAALETASHPVVVFSIADCLKDFLGPSFRVFHDDGHLTCFTGPVQE